MELYECRFSFSRAEVVAARHLSQVQIGSLVTFKACKASLGPAGKAVKSYYLKTTLYWLRQETPSDRWTSITRGLEMMLDYLEAAVAAGELPCFFWAENEINLLRPTTAAERQAMSETLALVRRHRSRLLAAELAGDMAKLLSPVLRLPTRQPSERQMRICLTRCLIVSGITRGLLMSMVSMQRVVCSDVFVAMLLRSEAFAELAYIRHKWSYNEGLQVKMFQALAVAPPDVAGRCRLTAHGRHGLVWDATPLLELLTPTDLNLVLMKPSAVREWLRRQHELPPDQRCSDLPADLRTSRDLADLVLYPPLLLLAIHSSVPGWLERVICDLRQFRDVDEQQVECALEPFEESRRQFLEISKSVDRTASTFQRKLGLDRETALLRAGHLKDVTLEFLELPSTRAEYDSIRTRLPDSWGLRKYAFC